jgi:uncharacterized membrane protein
MWLWIAGIVSSLGLVGTIAAAIAFPGVVIPVLQAIVGRLLKCKICMMVLAAIALVFVGALYGVHVEKERQAARIETMRQAAAAAAVERDGEVRADLEKSFAPALDAQRALVKSLQDKVKEYAERKPAAGKAVASVASCKLGDAAHLLRPPKVGRAAGAAKGGIADYLRRNFNED